MLLDAVPTSQQRTIAAQRQRLIADQKQLVAYRRQIAAQHAAATQRASAAAARTTASLRAQIAALRRRPPVRALPARGRPGVSTRPDFLGPEVRTLPGQGEPPGAWGAIAAVMQEIQQERAFTGHDPGRALTWMAQIKAAAPALYAEAMARTLEETTDSVFDAMDSLEEGLEGLGATAAEVKVASSPSAADTFLNWTKGLLNLGTGIKRLVSDDDPKSRTPYPNNQYPTTRPPPGYKPKAEDVAMLPLILLAGGGALYLFMTRNK